MTFPGQQDRGYAYLWWHTCSRYSSGPIEMPTAVGNGLQRIFLLRAQKTVVTFLSGRYNNFSANPPDRLMREFIVPALPRLRLRCPWRMMSGSGCGCVLHLNAPSTLNPEPEPDAHQSNISPSRSKCSAQTVFIAAAAALSFSF